MHQAKSGEKTPFQVNGIGVWHPDDGTILQQMLTPSFNIGRTPHRLRYDEPNGRTVDDVKLWNLTPSDLKVVAGTTRVIRIYRHQGDQIDLDQRIDWELPLTDSDFAKICKGVGKALRGISSSSPPIQHIFVKDLGKRAVSVELIRWLRQNFKNACWYVSSKAWRPPWFDELPKPHVRLILVPQLAAQRAINNGDISSSSWITAGGVPSQDAIKVIDELAETFSAAKIVVLPEGMRVLSRDSGHAYVLPVPGAADTLPFTPMASVFFPALGAYMIATKLDFSLALKNAVSFTATWEKAEAQRTRIDNWMPTPDQVLSVSDAAPGIDLLPWREFNWQRLESEWRQAFSGVGVVTTQDSKKKQKEEFQLWRAMTDVQGYVTCIPSKRRHLLTLLREGRSLKHSLPGDRRHKSFFLVDSPGSGKSFMVDCLASTLGMPCLKFNVTTLSRRDDLTDCFQKLSAAQSQSSELTPIVFFDEMNAKTDGQNVYDAFLEPLEDGSYVHNGKTFHLRPCLWIFAGTEAPTAGKSKEHPSNKAPDFESRLSRAVMYLGYRKSEDPDATADEHLLDQLRRVEQVYIGVATIRAIFPDVTKISKKVLTAFSLIPPDKVGPRGIKRLVTSLVYVQYGRVMGNNLPEKWFEPMQIDRQLVERWEDEEDSEELLVEIRSRAGN
ncbi:MAG: AAA family ATPase [Candidatus Sulfotelmatobacter sp.]